MKTYDSGYQGKKKRISKKGEGGVDHVRRMVSSLSKDKIQRMMDKDSSESEDDGKEEETENEPGDGGGKNQEPNSAPQNSNIENATDKDQEQDATDGTTFDESDNELLENYDKDLESSEWASKVLGNGKPKLKFKYRLMRLFWPPWWGKKGRERMITFLQCKLGVKSPFKKSNNKVSKIMTYWFKDVKKYTIKRTVVGVGRQPNVVNQVTVNQFPINPNNSYVIRYDMYNLPDQMVVTDGNGVQIANTGLAQNQGTVNIPVGTVGPITVTVTPGPTQPTQYKYSVLMNPQTVTVRKRVYLWGFIPIFKGFDKWTERFNPNKNYNTQRKWQLRTWKNRAGR